jgi:hypothetical protein
MRELTNIELDAVGGGYPVWIQKYFSAVPINNGQNNQNNNGFSFGNVVFNPQNILNNVNS